MAIKAKMIRKPPVLPAIPILSKGNFLDFIQDASISHQLVQALVAEIYKPNESAESLLSFFFIKGYYGVSLEDCTKLMSIVSAGPLPCDFSGDQY